MFAYTYSTPAGQVTIVENEGMLTHVSYSGSAKILSNIVIKETPIIRLAHQQLEEYFAGSRKKFDLPLNPAGTAFQQKVWTALQTIPYGQTASYKEIAAKVDNPKGCRAVGMANNKNPIAIIIPCHRVIGTNGKMVGYAGGLKIKEFLLNLEQGTPLFQDI